MDCIFKLHLPVKWFILLFFTIKETLPVSGRTHVSPLDANSFLLYKSSHWRQTWLDSEFFRLLAIVTGSWSYWQAQIHISPFFFVLWYDDKQRFTWHQIFWPEQLVPGGTPQNHQLCRATFIAWRLRYQVFFLHYAHVYRCVHGHLIKMTLC